MSTTPGWPAGRKPPLAPPPRRALGIAGLVLLLCGVSFGLESRELLPGHTRKILLPPNWNWDTRVVRADRDDVYQVRTRGGADAALRVFDAGERLLGENDDMIGLDAAVPFFLAAGQAATVEVFLSPGAAEQPGRATTHLAFERLSLPAAPVEPGTIASGSIAPGRPARFAFTAPDSGAMLVFTSVTGRLDTVLSVWGACGTLLARNDDRSPGNLSSLVVLRVEAGERYECLVHGYGPGDAGDFALELSGIEPVGDDDFPDSVREPPGRILPAPRLGIAASGEWETWGDADVVDLEFEEGGLYRFEIEARVDSTLVVYDADGRPVRADDDSGTRFNNRLLVEAGAGERLRVRIRPFLPSDRGPWKLWVRRVGDGFPEPVRRDIGPGRVHGLAFCVADSPPPYALVDVITDGWNFRRFLVRTLGAREEDVRVLIDDINTREDDLTVPRMRKEIAALAERVGPEDTVFFLYSGHGSDRGKGSVLEPEVRPYPMAWLKRDLDTIRAGRMVVIIDACNSGEFVEGLAAPNRWVISSSRLEQPSRASGTGQPEVTGGSLFLSYLYHQLMYIHSAHDLGTAFYRAATSVKRIFPGQQPQIHQPDSLAMPVRHNPVPAP